MLLVCHKPYSKHYSTRIKGGLILKRIQVLALFAAVLLTLLAVLLSYKNQAQAQASQEEVSVTFTGDILPHTSLYKKFQTSSGYDFSRTFQEISPLLDGDINLCHLETTLTKGTPSSYPSFATPYQLANSIKKHWQGCSIASNHTLDKGLKGVKTTREVFESLNFPVAGTKLSPSDDPTIYFKLPNDHTLAYLAYTYGTNGIRSPLDKPDLVNRISYSKIKKDILAASKKADLVILYLHWGTEYQEKPSPYQVSLAEKLLAIPELNAIVGSHVHLLQPGQLLNKKPAIYGLGNLWSGQGSWSNQPLGQIGAILKLNFIYQPTEKRYIYQKGYINPTVTLPSTWQVYPAQKLLETKDRTLACTAFKATEKLYKSLLETPPSCKRT